MFGFCSKQQLKPNFLPSPLPQWPQGQGFATGTINLGELEVAMVKDFEHVYTYTIHWGLSVSFYKPVSIPEGFFALGHYCQPNHDQPQMPIAPGYVLVARNTKRETEIDPSLKVPLRYYLIWSSENVYVWQPVPPVGYRALGFVVTSKRVTPDVEEVRCVRLDLTEKCWAVNDGEIMRSKSDFLLLIPKVCAGTGKFSKGVTVGTSYVAPVPNLDHELDICCLKNMNTNLDAMPNLEQVEALLDQYGPTVYFHPDEVYLPSSVPWFFKNGGIVSKNGSEFWLDLHLDDNNFVKNGYLKSAQVYAHIKPALGGTFTDIDMSIFYPFNSPDTCTVAYLFNLNMEAKKHVCSWEQFTLRVSNFDGQLWSVYFSQNTTGKWVNASSLEFIEENKPIVYSSKGGHATYPSAGIFIKGSMKMLGTGVKNIVEKSNLFIDSGKKYEIVAAEYLGDVVAQPEWLQYMPKKVPKPINFEQRKALLYNERMKCEEISSQLPSFIRPAMGWLIAEALRPEKAAWVLG